MIGNPKKPKELMAGYKDLKHLALVASMGCQPCKLNKMTTKYRLNVHHIIGAGGTGKKASDLLSFGACELHHTKGKKGEAVHSCKFAFAENYASERQLLEILNEEIADKHGLTGDKLRNYELIKEWLENEKKRGIL